MAHRSHISIPSLPQNKTKPKQKTKPNQAKNNKTKQNNTTTTTKTKPKKATKKEFFLSHDKSKIHCILNDNI